MPGTFRPIRKLLVANRGEIACRIMATCRRLGIATVAVHSEADAGAAHVAAADEAVAIGPAAARQSYLRADAILDAARATGAEAIHPGYGFLAESAGFARAVTEAGLVWVGPSPDIIASMGDKDRAREIAREAGVPILTGSGRMDEPSPAELAKAAAGLGFPLLVKAACGGGGIGMRRVDSAADLGAVVAATRSMAARAFGDGTVYLERFVARARHVEVQVFGFGDGTAVHLFERDCSLQRRYQKIVEEAPAPALPAALRSALQEAAVRLAAAVRYAGAGTVEFIHDVAREEFHFLEMNTRIQVEHPVTEMVTGIDLVEWQIRQAEGSLAAPPPLPPAPQGHAIEARLYAERPERGFLPAPGTVSGLVWPETGPDLRIDHALRPGDRITPHYDPMIAKLIARGPDRATALARLRAALAETSVEGVATNIAFLGTLLDLPEVRAGEIDTGLIGRLTAARPAA